VETITRVEILEGNLKRLLDLYRSGCEEDLFFGSDFSNPKLENIYSILNNLTIEQLECFVQRTGGKLQSIKSAARKRGAGRHQEKSTSSQSHGIRILVVDDEKPVRDAIGSLLRQEGYRVVVAEGGHAAVAAIEAFAFDLVIVDLFMPELDGAGTIKVLHEDEPALPIVAMGGYAFGDHSRREEFVRTLVDLGASDFLQKPFSREQLISSIERCWSLRFESRMIA
jgi:CheY-like chemotaxis protein